MPAPTVQAPDPVDWLVKPALYCVAAATLLATPVRAFGLQPPEPVFAMAPAFAWAAIRPSVLPPFALLALGLFQDVLWGGPAGLWPLCLLTVYGLAFLGRRALAAEGFGALWAWYAAFTAAGLGAGVLLVTAIGGEIPSLVGVGLQFVATLAVFPPAWLIIERFEDAEVRFH